ncbi:MAG: hypothetical protein H6838_00945 [Planctomycetes bacterium]|nr:hypothetical protein [Planctomycetota bacterium]
MKLHHFTMALVAGTLALQAAPCQGVSMTVRSPDGVAGYACEPFQCLPEKFLADAGGMLDCEVYGRRGTFFVMLGGMPTIGCTPVAGFDGMLALGSPVFTLGYGGVSDYSATTDCGLGTGTMNFVVPGGAVGMAFRLQAVGYSTVDVGLAFSRAVEIHLR